ncbi:MAG: hypothetical protein ABSH12_09660 [Endomicrobiales bacterium]|jgi:hypothetical protein
MKQFLVVLITLSVTFNVVVPRHLDAMVSDDTMVQAMRCQSVLLYYSFFSDLPIKIMNTLFGGQPAQDAATKDAADGQSSNKHVPPPNDLSVPDKTIVIKSVCLETVPSAGLIFATPGLCAPCFAERGRLATCPSGWSATVHQWMVMLPRGSIDDHIKTITMNLNKPIGIHSQLAFSFGGLS